MNCPNCAQEIPTRPVERCTACGRTYPTPDLLELHRLDFLVAETAAWPGIEAQRAPYVDRLAALRDRLRPRPAPQPHEAAPAPPPPPPPAPPKEKVPFDQWLLSERNIKIALYSGALLLVVAGLIFVGVNWGRLPGPAKFAITVLVTGLMYLGGYTLLRREAYRIGGIALLGIASGFVAVNLAILQLYVLGPAGLRNDVMWLIASLLCLALYLATAVWTRGDLFVYFGLAAAVSGLAAVLVVVDAPPLVYPPAGALLACGLLAAARAVHNTPLAAFARRPLLLVAQVGMALAGLAALAGWLVTQNGYTFRMGSSWLSIAALALGALFYAATNLLFKWPAARWIAAPFAPLVLALVLLQVDAGDTATALALMLLALAYLGLGALVARREGRPAGAWPLYATAYAVALLVTVLAIPRPKGLYKVLFADVLLLALSAAVHRRYEWIYGAVWLSLLPIYLILHLYVPDIVYRGLLMGLLGLNYAAAGYVLGRRSLMRGGPFLTAAAAAGVVAAALTWTDPLVGGLVLAALALLTLAAALWQDWPWLLLPALLAVHLALFQANDLLLAHRALLPRALTLTYAALGLALGLGGFALRRLGHGRWGGPLYLVAGLDLVAAYAAGLILGGALAAGLSAVMALLLLALAWLERDALARRKLSPLPAYLAAGALFVGHLTLLSLFRVRVDDPWPLFTAGLCTLFLALAWLLRHEPLAGLYGAPLRHAGRVLMAVPLLGAVGLLILDDQAVLLAATFALAGLAFGADGALRRMLGLVYLGIAALVVVIWGVLLALDVSEFQFYVIPLGLALLGVGWHEQRRGRSLSYQACTLSGLAVLMGATFVQSLGHGHWPYALLLLVESLAATAWGITRRLRRWVQAGVVALLANALAQLGPAFVDLSGWIQLGLAGSVLLGGGLLALLKRDDILSARQTLTQEWRQWEQ